MKGSFRRWLRDHASAALIATELIAALLLLFVGLLIGDYQGGSATEQALWRTAGIVAINLSGVLLAAATATVFFSLADVRAALGSALRQLLAEGTVLDLVSPAVRETLRKRIVASRFNTPPDAIDKSFYRHLLDIERQSIGSVYVTNLRINYNVGRPDDAGRRRVVVHRTFRAHAPLATESFTYPVRLWVENIMTADVSFTHDDWVRSVRVTIGEEELAADHLEVHETVLPTGLKKYVGKLSLDVEVESPEVEVSEYLESTLSFHDPVINFFARFPTKGMSAFVSHDEPMNYDPFWYLFCPPEQDTPARGSRDFLPNGVSVNTNDWVLPGEGVGVAMHPQIPGADQPGILPGPEAVDHPV